MNRRIEIIRPNLFLAEGVFENAGEVYFSLASRDNFKEASLLVDSIVTENVGPLKVGQISNILPADVISRFRAIFHYVTFGEYGNFGLPFKEYLENPDSVKAPFLRKPENPPSGQSESREAPQLIKPVFWDLKLDPREIVYAATSSPDDARLARILADFEAQIAKLEAANNGLLVYDRSATKKAIESHLEKAGKKIGSHDAFYHVVSVELPSGQKNRNYPIGRVSIFPAGIGDDESVRRVLKVLAGSLEGFDGPRLSIDNVPGYMHALKGAETLVEAISRGYGDYVRVTNGRIGRRQLLLQE